MKNFTPGKMSPADHSGFTGSPTPPWTRGSCRWQQFCVEGTAMKSFTESPHTPETCRPSHLGTREGPAGYGGENEDGSSFPAASDNKGSCQVCEGQSRATCYREKEMEARIRASGSCGTRACLCPSAVPGKAPVHFICEEVASP